MADMYDPAFDPMAAGGGSGVRAPSQSAKAGDYVRAVGTGALDLGASMASGARAGLEDSGANNVAPLADFLHDLLKRGSEDVEEGMTPDARELLRSSITSPEFWEHPFSAAGLKAANMSPMVAASVAPAMLTDGAIVPWLTAGVGGAMGAGTSAEDAYAQTDTLSDEEFQKHMPYYAGLRSLGMPEDEARADANSKLRGLKPVLNGIAGAIGMLAGPGGRLAGILPEGAGAGLLKRMGAGAAEGALGGALMGGTAEATHEQTEIELDKRTQLDPALIIAATGNSALEMGALGAVGGVFSGHGEPAAKKPETKPVDEISSRGPDPAQTAALQPKTETPAAPVTEPGNPKGWETNPIGEGPVLGGEPEPTYRTNPGKIAAEHEAEVSGLEAQGAADAAAKLPQVPNLADDAGQTTPEAPATFEAQAQQLRDGQRRAMLFPRVPGGKESMAAKAEKLKMLPEGMKTVVTKDGIIFYNPEHLKYRDVTAASKEGRLNEILDLGDFSKKDLEPLVAAGEQPLAVTERAPDGVEVKAAAGTESTAPSQIESLEATKTPGNSVQVEPLQQVIAGREAAAPRVLRAEPAPAAEPAAAPRPPAPKAAPKPVAEPVAEPVHAPHPVMNALDGQAMAKVSYELERHIMAAQALEAQGHTIKGGLDAFIERKRAELLAQAQKELGGGIEEAITEPRARAEEKGEGKHYTKEQKETRAKNNERADAVVARFDVSELEAKNHEGKGLDLLSHRLRSMLDAAQREGVKLPAKLKDIIEKEMEHNNSVALLVEAKNLLKGRKGNPPVEEAAKFASRESQLRTGKAEDKAAVLAERRAENDLKYNRYNNKAENAVDPEAALEAEKMRLEEIADDAPREFPEEADLEDNEPMVVQREREPVTLKGNEVNAVKDRAGTFKSETVKQRRRVSHSALDEFEHPGNASSALRLERAIEGKTIHEVAEHIANEAPNMAQRFIARRVAKVLKKMEANGVKFGFHVAHIGDTIPRSLSNARGLSTWSKASRESHVWINGTDVRGKEGTTYQTVLHELLHAATQQAIDIGTHGRGDFMAKQLRNELLNLGDKVVAAFNKKATAYKNGDLSALNDFERQIFQGRNNALLDEHELLAWGLTNPHMQDFLESVPYKNGTLFSGFVESIRKFLGLAPRQHTALSELIRISDHIFELDDAEISHRLKMNAIEQGWLKEGAQSQVQSHAQVGDFAGAQGDIDKMFHSSFTDAVSRTTAGGRQYVRSLTSPTKMISSAIGAAHTGKGVLSRALLAVTTNDQYRQQIGHLVPMARDIFDNNERAGVLANKLKEEGLDLTGAMIRAQKINPGLFEKFAKLVHDQTMVGADASMALGEGRNSHLGISKALQAKIDKGLQLSDVEHETAMRAWEGRGAHSDLETRYKAIIKADPQYAALQSKLFDHYEKTQSAMVRGQIDAILRAYEFKGTPEERAAMAAHLYSGKIPDDVRVALEANIGKQAVNQIENVQGLKVVNGPYAPLMRRGEHAVLGEYKVEAPTNGAKIDDDTWEFKTRKEARDFAVKTGLHSDTKSVYYDTATGKRVKAKADAISTGGQPEQRFHVRLERQHLEFHETAKEARERHDELKASGLMEKLGLEQRRNILGEHSQFNGRGVETLLASLSQQDYYKNASEHERGVMRHTIREAGLRSMSDNRVQSRRLPRRFVKGHSDDVARNLYEYTNAQANYRARLQYRDSIDRDLKAMWEHVKAERYTPDNEARSAAANEIERRMQLPDPNDYTGAYSEWTRRLGTWSYIDRMMRPSHLILHQTHLPMITAPYMSGRHGVVTAYAATMKAWKDLTGFYSAGGHDAWASTWGSALQKGADYTELGKKAYSAAPDSARLNKMLDTLGEIGVIHPSAGMEAQKYLPSRQLSGPLGALDKGLNKIDTIFRHLTNSTEAINRIAGATAAYRLEFSKLTREGKNEAQAHDLATEYARQTLTDTQGLYSATNAAPVFKNKFLKPFLQFKQFPQMMYHLLGKLVTTAYKGETRKAKVQAVASLAAILGMHSMMAGVIQGVPLEPFKLLALISKGIGLTDSDWTDVENAERSSIKSVFGDDVGNLMIHGLGSELLGVDVHHRLGLNSFVTFGMPDQLDSKSVSEFMMNSVLGAPGSLVTDALKGTHKMLNGDLEGGAFQAAPLQALRDVRNAISPPPNKYGYEPTGVDRAKSVLGFTPAKKAHLAEQKNAVFNAAKEYDTQRYALTRAWVDAADKEDAWSKISEWNMGQQGDARITKGDLFKALHRANSIISHNRSIGGVKVNAHNKGIAEATLDLYN